MNRLLEPLKDSTRWQMRSSRSTVKNDAKTDTRKAIQYGLGSTGESNWKNASECSESPETYS